MSTPALGHLDQAEVARRQARPVRKKRLVPVEGSHETDDGRLVLPYDKQCVMNGPAARSECYPDAATTQLAAQHYQIEA